MNRWREGEPGGVRHRAGGRWAGAVRAHVAIGCTSRCDPDAGARTGDGGITIAVLAAAPVPSCEASSQVAWPTAAQPLPVVKSAMSKATPTGSLEPDLPSSRGPPRPLISRLPSTETITAGQE